MHIFFFRVSVTKRRECSQAFLAESMKTRDKNHDDFHCMQMSLVMSKAVKSQVQNIHNKKVKTVHLLSPETAHLLCNKVGLLCNIFSDFCGADLCVF